MASRHRDATGRPPQHTWFYPGEQFEPDIMRVLGTGGPRVRRSRIPFPSRLRYRRNPAARDAARVGSVRNVRIQSNERRQDPLCVRARQLRARQQQRAVLCGVSTEIAMLHELGAFADFTFPSVYQESQPSVVNRIYAAKDDERPKSYDRPLPLNALTRGEADLMIFEGPLVFSPTWNLRRLFSNSTTAISIRRCRPARLAWIAGCAPTYTYPSARTGVHQDVRPRRGNARGHRSGDRSAIRRDAELYGAAVQRRHTVPCCTTSPHVRRTTSPWRLQTDTRAIRRIYDYLIPPYIAGARR